MVVEKEVGEIEANDTSTRRPVLSEVTSDATLPVNQTMNTFPRPVVEHDAGALVFFLRCCIWDQVNHTKLFCLWVGPEGNDSGNAPMQAGRGGLLADTQASEEQEVDHVPLVGVYMLRASGYYNDSGPGPPTIGDFDSSANALWELYVKEAKSNDVSQIQSLREDMGEVLIFVCYIFPPHPEAILIRDPIGGFIFHCPHRIHS